MPIKIAMIGAGSIGFTRKLMHDILAVPELAGTHFAFMEKIFLSFIQRIRGLYTVWNYHLKKPYQLNKQR